MKKKKSENEEIEETQEEELSEKEQKKLERKAGVEKRKKARQKDKVARFAGIILLGMILLIGFLLWVAGEMQSEQGGVVQPRPTPPPLYQNSDPIRVR